MIEITVGICEAFKAIGIDISEADLKKFEQTLYDRGLNVAPRTHGHHAAPDGKHHAKSNSAPS
ncbi:hypothetical protein ACWAT4_21500 [Bradyrhizobium manausense]